MLGGRPDGRHEISSVVQAISLHDLLEVAAASVTSLEVSGFNVPVDESNLVLKALRALESVAERPLPARIRLLKRIPPGAGLGGGSSDAAAALRALRRLHDLDVQLEPVAAELGSDVSFFLRGGRARMTGHGDRIHPLPAEAGWFAVAWPELEVSTADVYRRWDELGGSPPNELEKAALDLHPELARYRERLGPGWRLTGSGSAWFKACGSKDAAGQAAAGVPGWSAVVRTVGAWT